MISAWPPTHPSPRRRSSLRSSPPPVPSQRLQQRRRHAESSPLDAHRPPRRGRCPDGGRIVDGRGREVLLRGVNVNALAEYWKGTDFPTTFPLAPDDPARMRSIGWNAVRLLVSWSRVEPAPGRYDEKLPRRGRANRRPARTGGALLHRRLPSGRVGAGDRGPARRSRANPPPSPGSAGTGRRHGPRSTRGLPRCTVGSARAQPRDHARVAGVLRRRGRRRRVGIQTRYVAMLGHVARRFARRSGGRRLRPHERAQRVQSGRQRTPLGHVRPGRRGDPRRGARRAGFRPPDPLRTLRAVLRDRLGTATGVQPRPKPRLRAAHLHRRLHRRAHHARRRSRPRGARPPGSAACPCCRASGAPTPSAPTTPTTPTSSSTSACRTSSAPAPPSGPGARAAETRTRSADFRAGRVPEVWGEFDVDCRDNSVGGARDALIAQLRRGYVRAAPGMLTATRWDHRPRPPRRVRSSGRTATAGSTRAFHPAAGSRDVKVTVHGLESPRFLAVKGGGVLISATPKGGRWSILATRAPASADRRLRLDACLPWAPAVWAQSS